jgi:hypothetical protein
LDAKNRAYTHIAPISAKTTMKVDVNAIRFMMVLRVVNACPDSTCWIVAMSLYAANV